MSSVSGIITHRDNIVDNTNYEFDKEDEVPVPVEKFRRNVFNKVCLYVNDFSISMLLVI